MGIRIVKKLQLKAWKAEIESIIVLFFEEINSLWIINNNKSFFGKSTGSFVYNDNDSRVKMELKKNSTSELRRYYFGGQYELDEGVSGTKEKLYLGGDYYYQSIM